MKLEDIQKGRYSTGAIVYNTNNNNYAIVLSGQRGCDNDPTSLVIEFSDDHTIVHTPPNRALIPTGRFYDLRELKKSIGV